MPGYMRVQAVFQGATNVPEDRFINTFHFEWFGAGATYADQSPIIAQAVDDFYTSEGSNARSLDQLMSPFIVSATINTYDLSLPEGEREPTTYTLELATTSVTPNFPEEVAVCLSLAGAPPVTPRRRGRLFFGPLVADSDVVVYGNATTPTRVNITSAQSVGVTLAERAETLASSELFNWCIRSVTPSENFVAIVAGHVDDAFDTIRKRGPDTSARLTWAA